MSESEFGANNPSEDEPPSYNDIAWRIRLDARLSHIENDNKEIKTDIRELDKKFDSYTHIYQFIPVRNIAYGLVTSFGVGIVGALIAVITTSGAGP